MNRRRVLRLTIGASMAAPLSSLWAQSAAVGLRRIGVLAPSPRATEEVILKPFFDEMRRLGWIEGQSIAYDRAYADDQQRNLPRLAAELVARKPELIFAPPTVAAIAAKQATRTIPIVFGTGTDPVGAGLVASLAHPGGNVTPEGGQGARPDHPAGGAGAGGRDHSMTEPHLAKSPATLLAGWRVVVNGAHHHGEARARQKS
jgi:putative ABC transport system substrate-binding protein